MSLLFPFDALLDEAKIYEWFAAILWPAGPVCPRCGRRDDLHVHAQDRAPLVDWRCRQCKRVFNLFTGTVFQGTHHRMSRLFAIVRGVAQGVSTNQLHKEVGCNYRVLLDLRHKIQAWVTHVITQDPKIKSQVAEADEMYQNAGEKREKARGPGRSPATSRKQTEGTRDMGQRSSARGRSGRS